MKAKRLRVLWVLAYQLHWQTLKADNYVKHTHE